MERLWAPWRLEYITGEKTEGCIFCEFPKRNDDEKYLILHRGARVFVIMNAFPYSNGHLLIAPYRHTGSFSELTGEENHETMRLAQRACEILHEIAAPDGFNVGLNIGAAAGAGIADHLHMHVVPRWIGDTNFMPVLGETRVIPEALRTTYAKLRPLFDRLRR